MSQDTGHALKLPRGRPPRTGSAQPHVLLIGGSQARYLRSAQATVPPTAASQTPEAPAAPTAPDSATRAGACDARDDSRLSHADSGDSGDGGMFEDSGLPISTHSPARQDQCCCTNPSHGVDDGCGSSMSQRRPYLIELQAFWGLEQEAPAPLSVDPSGAVMFMMPGFDEQKGGLSMQRFLYPTVREMQSAEGPVLAQWCTCSPEHQIRKEVLQHMPSDGKCSAADLVGTPCLHTATLKVTNCMHACGLACVHDWSLYQHLHAEIGTCNLWVRYTPLL